jgi:hypothetical protein
MHPLQVMPHSNFDLFMKIHKPVECSLNSTALANTVDNALITLLFYLLLKLVSMPFEIIDCKIHLHLWAPAPDHNSFVPSHVSADV